MDPYSGEATTDPGDDAAYEALIELGMSHDGDFQVRRVEDDELLERTGDLRRAVQVANDHGYSYIDLVAVCPGDPCGWGLGRRQRREVRAGASLFADRTVPEELRAREGKAGLPITRAMLDELDVMLVDHGVERIGLPRHMVQEALYKEACTMGRES